MKRQFLSFVLLSVCLASSAIKAAQAVETTQSTTPPDHLYLFMSLSHWKFVNYYHLDLSFNQELFFTEEQCIKACDLPIFGGQPLIVGFSTTGLTGTFALKKCYLLSKEDDLCYCYSGTIPLSAFFINRPGTVTRLNWIK